MRKMVRLMALDNLEGITEVGFRVEKAQKNNYGKKENNTIKV